jgi:thiamine biosynthesis lipoprotein
MPRTAVTTALHTFKQTSRWLVGVAGLLLCFGCATQTHAPALKRFHYAQIKMGVQARLVVYAPDEATAERACTAAYQRVSALEDSMSDYRPRSELLQLCARAGSGPVKVSEELFYVLKKARELSEKTDGAFDVTVGPLVQLWRAARKTGKLPSAAALEQAKQLVGWRTLVLDERSGTVNLTKPGMRLDLGGIAKGYAGDQVLAVLKSFGITRALFEAGGDIVVGDPPPGKTGWPIDVENPIGSAGRLKLANCAISTSGDTVQFVEIGGTRYSHVVDPRTGLGLTSHYAATIIAPAGIDSDALSTAACVLGPDAAGPILKAYAARGWIRRVDRPASTTQAAGVAPSNPHIAVDALDRAGEGGLIHQR